MKEFVTTQEAALRLHTVEAGIYQLALDGQLNLSVWFVNDVLALPGEIVPKATVMRSEPRVIAGVLLKDETCDGDELRDPDSAFVRANKAVSLRGIYDLPMIGREYYAITELCSGVQIEDLTDFHVSGTYVTDESGKTYQLCDQTQSEAFYPIKLKAVGHEIVVRQVALEVYEQMSGCKMAPSKEPEETDISLEDKLIKIVKDNFWRKQIPEGHNRPTQKQIVDWLLTCYKKEGLTMKAADRIYKISKPNDVPKNGNTKHTNKQFPTPPCP